MSLIFLLLILSSCSVSLLSAADDGAVLLKIKEQLGNPDILSNWVEGFDFCRLPIVWSIPNVTIGCSSSGRVEQLYFSNNLIVNDTSFPQAICNLTELTIFEMNYVLGMHGPLPSCISNLVHLESFTMEYNPDFSSPVPEFLNNKNLSWVYIVKSGLYGPIPPSLSTSSLPKLRTLDLSWNAINGTIPWELAHHPPTDTLALNNNNMSGELLRCATWENLGGAIDLSHNSFIGDASSLFGKEKTIMGIILSYNNFSFDISKIEISERCYHLDLSHNQIYGKVPESAYRYYRSLNLEDNIPCAEKNQKPHACLCGDPYIGLQWLPPCPVLPPPPAP